MTLEFSVNGTPLPAEAILENPAGTITLPSAAWYGEISTARISVDDPFGDYDFRAWDVFTADESEATNPRVFTGWIFTATMSRGPYRDGPARVWQLDILDQNAALGFNFFRANSAQRPAETDVARVEFILESEPMAWTPVVAGPLTNLTDNVVNLQEYDMVRVTPVEALTTTAGHAGKTFHVFWNHDDAELQLYYDTIANYPAATASISNVIADAGADVYYPFIDANLTRAGDQVYTGELIDFVGGSAFGENATTIDRLSPTPLSPVSFKRAFMRRSDAIGRLETANAIIQSDLASQATEENTIQVTIRVPAANVNDIEAGQRVTVRFTHLQGYETDTPVNCIRRDVSLTEGRTDTYDIVLELSDKAKLRELDGGDPDVFPPADCNAQQDATIVQQGMDIAPDETGGDGLITLGATPTPGNTLILNSNFRGVGLFKTPTGFDPITSVVSLTEEKNFFLQGWIRVVEEGDTDTVAFDGNGTTTGWVVQWVEYVGELEIVDTDTTYSGTDLNPPDSRVLTGGTVTVPTNGFAIAGVTPGIGTPNTSSAVEASGSDEIESSYTSSDNLIPQTWLGEKRDDGAVSVGVTVTMASGVMREAGGWSAALVCVGTADAPCIAPGQPSQEDEPADPDVGDGTTTTFSTRCPFADETLHVKVDNLNQDAAVVSYDGAAGTFTLGFAPVAGEQVTVNYLGRP